MLQSGKREVDPAENPLAKPDASLAERELAARARARDEGQLDPIMANVRRRGGAYGQRVGSLVPQPTFRAVCSFHHERGVDVPHSNPVKG
jgi:hypothetical protein